MAQKSREDLKNEMIGYIEDAYALERQLEQVLGAQAAAASAYPAIQKRLAQHQAETQVQAKRLAELLESYGRSPNAIKTAVGTVMGNMIGLAGGLRGETLSRNMRDAYVSEHLEIAGYTLLIDTARHAGEDKVVKVAEMILQEEIAMQAWCAEHLTESLHHDQGEQGIEVPGTDAHTATPVLRVTFEPATDAAKTTKA
jgi:ferritin-like metal-binding protein YciE